MRLKPEVVGWRQGGPPPPENYCEIRAIIHPKQPFDNDDTTVTPLAAGAGLPQANDDTDDDAPISIASAELADHDLTAYDARFKERNTWIRWRRQFVGRVMSAIDSKPTCTRDRSRLSLIHI